MSVSKIFIFFGVFYVLVYISTFCITASFPNISTDPGCLRNEVIGAANGGIQEPNGLNFLSVAWNGIKWFLTAGLSTMCGFPAALLWLFGIFNIAIIILMFIGLVFLIRGSS